MKHTFTIINAAVAERSCGIIKGLDYDKPHEVVIRPRKSNRSLAQNNLLHKWMGEVSQAVGESHGKFYPPPHWKEYFKSMFLGEETIQVGKKVMTLTRSTAKLKVDEFSKLLENIDHYCGSTLGIILEHPADLFNEAMGIRRK